MFDKCGRRFVLPNGREFLNTYTPEFTVRIATSLKKKWVGYVEGMEKI
jgi:hypothetical protein